MKAFDPQQGKQLAEDIRKNPMIDLQLALTRSLFPLSRTAALNDYLHQLHAGKATKAEEVLKQYAAKGVPLPVGK